MLSPGAVWRRLDEGWRLALGLLLVQRIVLGLLGVFAQRGSDRVAQGGNAVLVIRGGEPWSLFLSIWQRWDALWYQRIAEEGYGVTNGTMNFYPLFPLLSRGLSIPLGGHIVWAELIVTSVCFVLAMRLLYELALQAGQTGQARWLGNARQAAATPGAVGPADRRVAVLAVLLVALFPSWFFLVAPFTESLFLTVVLASFWFARRHQWWLAGGAGFLGALTRANGVVLALPLAFAYLRHRGIVRWLRRAGGLPPGWALPAIAGPVAGALVWAFYARTISGEGPSGGSALLERALSRFLSAALGSPDPSPRVADGRPSVWRVVPPWEALSAGFEQALRDVRHLFAGLPVPDPRILAGVEILNLVVLLGFSGLAIVAVRRLPLEYSFYLWPNLAILLTRRMEILPLESVSRYALVLFPCFILAAVLLERRPRAAVAWLATSYGLQLVLFHQFVRWRFIA